MFAREMVFQWLGCSGVKTVSTHQALVHQAPHIRPNGLNMAQRQVLRWDLRSLLKPGCTRHGWNPQQSHRGCSPARRTTGDDYLTGASLTEAADISVHKCAFRTRCPMLLGRSSQGVLRPGLRQLTKPWS